MDLPGGFPGPHEVDDFGFEQANYAFCQSLVITVAHAADRWVDTGFYQAFGVFDRKVLAAPVAVMDQVICPRWSPLTDCLAQSVQNKIDCHGCGHTPTDDATGEDTTAEAHQDRMRTSNGIERTIQQELKRRTSKVRVFPTLESLERLSAAVLVEIDEEWETETKAYIKWEQFDE